MTEIIRLALLDFNDVLSCSKSNAHITTQSAASWKAPSWTALGRKEQEELAILYMIPMELAPLSFLHSTQALL